MTRFLFAFLLLGILGAGPQVRGQSPLESGEVRQLQQLVEANEVFATSHLGFVLYSMDGQSQLYGYNADRNFVPASNAKLLTFYLAQRLLGHRTPAAFYQEYPDRIELWGTGYPLMLHPSFGAYDELYPWLAHRTKPLILHFPEGDAAVPRYGAGWSWDDYNGSYVYERATFPVYGNRLYLDLSPADSMGRQGLLGSPPSISGALRHEEKQAAVIRRSEFGNDFSVGPELYTYDDFPLERPLHLSRSFITNEIAAALPQLRISSDTAAYPTPAARSVMTASLPDTVYRKLLQDSDNFLAEQLILQASAQRYGVPSTAVLDYAQDTLLPTLGVGKIRWVDGSGLSRYNLLSPRALARVVLALDQEVGRRRLLGLLPAGGASGTLKNRFEQQDRPWLWAKTGSLSGVLTLSGIMVTKQGKWLAFSLMQNNYVGKSSDWYREVEKIMSWCYEEL